MNCPRLWFAVAVTAGLAAAACLMANDSSKRSPLPAPKGEGKMSLEQSLNKRRSVRRFSPGALSRQQIAQLCWAAQGVSDPERGYRTCPSAGALYPLELYIVTAAGVEHYIPDRHVTEKHLDGDLRRDLQAAAMGQSCVGQAPATFVFTAVVSRTQRKYGQRAERYVWIEVGHAAQNLLLQATAMKLGAVPVGAFQDKEIAKALSLPADQAPLYLIPVGMPK
ncbi:MAG: SagB/ThcOx family dehydrogenase [Planctomycetota bacterium]|nr:SagB/ThcOx family dehydrogenase [Planctomycetota bacterium]